MRDIEVYTELVGVVRSELMVDKHDRLTEPDDDSICYHTTPLFRDASLSGRGRAQRKARTSNIKPNGLNSAHEGEGTQRETDNTTKESPPRRDSRRNVCQEKDSTLINRTFRSV